jgi:hypothetical protein
MDTLDFWPHYTNPLYSLSNWTILSQSSQSQSQNQSQSYVTTNGSVG